MGDECYAERKAEAQPLGRDAAGAEGAKVSTTFITSGPAAVASSVWFRR